MVICGIIEQPGLQKKLYPMVTFVASSLVSLFNLFSKYMQHFEPSSKPGFKLTYCDSRNTFFSFHNANFPT